MSLKTASQLAADLAAGSTTSRALTEGYLRAIERTEPTLHSFVTVIGEKALAAADAADARRAAGQTRSVLDGVPIAVKDNTVSYTHLTLPTNREV